MKPRSSSRRPLSEAKRWFFDFRQAFPARKGVVRGQVVRTPSDTSAIKQQGFSLGPKSRSRVIAAGVMGAVLLLAVAWAAIVWSRPALIRIAFANSLTGPSGPAGLESLVATRLAIDEVNAKGGSRGRPTQLLPFDDASSAETARANVQAIADSPCVAVLGHYLSTASLAAGPGYKSARIPALTGTSFVNDLTRGNEFYFRAQTTSSLQGRSIAEYLRAVLKEPTVHLVHSRDRFGSELPPRLRPGL